MNLLLMSHFIFAQNSYDARTVNADTVTYENLYNQFINMGNGPLKYAHVDSLSFKRDVADFRLNKGEIYLLPKINKKYRALLYKGEGRFNFTPPTKIEKEQLFRFYNTQVMEKSFNTLFIFFSDSTLREFEQNIAFLETPENTIKDDIKNVLKYMGDDDDEYIRSKFFTCLTDEAESGFFYAHFHEEIRKPFFFEINPDQEEEVRFSHRAETAHMYYIPEVICQFHQVADYRKPENQRNDTKNNFKVESYKIETNIDNNLELSGKTEITLHVLKGIQKWIHFSIYSEMIIDSVKTSQGKKLHFFKPEETSVFWIKTDSLLTESSTVKYTIYYKSDKILERDLDAWVYMRTSTNWYPHYNSRKKTHYDMTFHYPENWMLVSVGEEVETTEEDDVITSRWITKSPVIDASFNIGDFKKFEVNHDAIPPIVILKSKAGHIFGERDIEEKIGEDVLNSILLFKDAFGPVPIKSFYVSEIPYDHGEAFPGFIHLSWATFEESGSRGYHEIFRAHEVAHQWWGIEVDFKTYHDQWLSEAFSEYSGLWFMQTIYKDNEKFFDVMDKYRESIFTNRKYLFGDEQQAGPISLGYRTSSSKTGGDYNLIIYKKGAWVLHMLRIMMLDLNTMNEDRFKNMLRDFYTTLRGKKASTSDFVKIVEKHMGKKMDWFFDQWINGTDLPEYKFAYKVTPTKDKMYLVKCIVKQQNTTFDFKMPVVLQIEFPNKALARISREIMGDTTVFEFKLPMKPEKIEFNYLKSVLAEVEYVNFNEFK